jgi:hypothetical protein
MWRVIRHGHSDQQVIASALNEFKALYHQLKNLEKTNFDKPLETLVEYFDLISNWGDKEITNLVEALSYQKNNASLIQKITNFQNNAKSERQPFGWNRTNPGQKVTADDVYLGNEWGLFTKKVSFWLQNKNEPKGGWGHAKNLGIDWDNLNAYDVVAARQAKPYLERRLKSNILISEEIAYELSRVL